MFCFKFLDGKLPKIFDSFYTSMSDAHDHSTRISDELYIETPRTIYAKQSVRYLAPFTWNSLPSILYQEKRLKSFKRQVIDHLLGTLLKK